MEVDGENALVVSMDARQGIAPRVDALRNSYAEVVAELRARDGAARAYFVAPAGGPHVQATKFAKDIDDATPAATCAPSAKMVLLLSGGTPSGSIPAGLAGVGAEERRRLWEVHLGPQPHLRRRALSGAAPQKVLFGRSSGP